MKLILITTALLFSQLSFSKIVEAEENLTVTPASIYMHKAERQLSTAVTLVASLIGGAHSHSAAFITIGGLEDDSNTFQVMVNGFISKFDVEELEDGSLFATIISSGAKLNEETGRIETATVKTTFRVEKDHGTYTSYSKTAKVTESFPK